MVRGSGCCSGREGLRALSGPGKKKIRHRKRSLAFAHRLQKSLSWQAFHVFAPERTGRSRRHTIRSTEAANIGGALRTPRLPRLRRDSMATRYGLRQRKRQGKVDETREATPAEKVAITAGFAPTQSSRAERRAFGELLHAADGTQRLLRVRFACIPPDVLFCLRCHALPCHLRAEAACSSSGILTFRPAFASPIAVRSSTLTPPCSPLVL
jgi:hypothetical protein